MATSEYKGVHFVCKLKMESEIACAWGSANSNIWSDNDLYYVYTHPVGGGTVSIQITTSMNQIAVKQLGPVNYTTGYGPSWSNNITTPGMH